MDVKVQLVIAEVRKRRNVLDLEKIQRNKKRKLLPMIYQN
jgi:hypothetical protein